MFPQGSVVSALWWKTKATNSVVQTISSNSYFTPFSHKLRSINHSVPKRPHHKILNYPQCSRWQLFVPTTLQIVTQIWQNFPSFHVLCCPQVCSFPWCHHWSVSFWLNGICINACDTIKPDTDQRNMKCCHYKLWRVQCEYLQWW